MKTKNIQQELVYVNVRMPKTLVELLEQAITSDTHTSRSEFVRDAIRKELERRGFIPSLPRKPSKQLLSGG